MGAGGFTPPASGNNRARCDLRDRTELALQS